MAKKFFKCLSLLLIFTLSLFGSAAAKSKAEITSISAYDITDNILRVEVAFDGSLTKDDVTISANSRTLSVSLENTTPGRISKISGTKIENSEFVKKITVKEIEMHHTRVRITLSRKVTDKSYKFSVQPESRSEKKPARIVIDILKNGELAIEPEVEEEEFEMPPVLKADDKVVVLDAGHGGSDAGAIGPRGVTEKSVALAVALKTEKILKDEGMKVVMTRRTDIDVASAGASNSAELQARVSKAPPQADVFISIHCNAFSNPNSNGMETYYSAGANPKSQRLAQLLNEELAKYGGLYNRGVKAANFYVIKHTRCPSSLIELGFITNAKEEKLLSSEKYQNKLAAAIASAVKRFFMN